MSLMKIKREKVKTESIIIGLSIILFFIMLETGIIGNFAVMILLIPTLFLTIRVCKFGIMEKLIVVYWTYGLLLTLIRHNAVYDFSNAFKLLMEYAIIFISCFAFKSRKWEEILTIIRNFGIAICIVGLLEAMLKFPIMHYVLTGDFNTQSYGSDSFRICLIFGRPIIAGTMLVFFWMTLFFRPLKNRRANIIAHIVIISNIILCQARSCWIAFLFAIIAITGKNHLITRTVKKRTINFVVVLLITVLMLQICGIDLIGNVYQFISSRIEGTLEAGTGQIIRIENMISSFDYWFKEGHILLFLFGGGKNYSITFMNEHPVWKFNWKWEGVVDNQYLSVIHDFGLIGFSVLIGIILIAVRRLCKCDQQDKYSVYANIALVCTMICIFFYEGLNYPLITWLIVMQVMQSEIVSSNSCLFENKGDNIHEQN